MKKMFESRVNEIILQYLQKTLGGDFLPSERIIFVLPSMQLKKIVRDLIKYEKVRRAFFGIKIEPYFKDKKGYVIVREVMPDSPAEKAKMLKGDVIVALNEMPVRSMKDIYQFLLNSDPGDKAKITVLRGEEEIVLEVTLGEKAEEK